MEDHIWEVSANEVARSESELEGRIKALEDSLREIAKNLNIRINELKKEVETLEKCVKEKTEVSLKD